MTDITNWGNLNPKSSPMYDFKYNNTTDTDSVLNIGKKSSFKFDPFGPKESDVVGLTDIQPTNSPLFDPNNLSNINLPTNSWSDWLSNGFNNASNFMQSGGFNSLLDYGKVGANLFGVYNNYRAGKLAEDALDFNKSMYSQQNKYNQLKAIDALATRSGQRLANDSVVAGTPMTATEAYNQGKILAAQELKDRGIKVKG